MYAIVWMGFYQKIIKALARNVTIFGANASKTALPRRWAGSYREWKSDKRAHQIHHADQQQMTR